MKHHLHKWKVTLAIRKRGDCFYILLYLLIKSLKGNNNKTFERLQENPELKGYKKTQSWKVTRKPRVERLQENPELKGYKKTQSITWFYRSEHIGYLSPLTNTQLSLILTK